ncbi:MAG: hypothetical protein H4O13_05195 [Xanthomonadales bacterium]|nr:hypothetical protein [Xanthomonadales bacterium]
MSRPTGVGEQARVASTATVSCGAAGRSARRRIGLIALLSAAGLLASPLAAAQSLSEQQVLRAPARGEGAPDLLMGGQVAIDGDLAVVAERRMGSLLRGYRRVAGVWQRAPELDRRVATESIDDLALSEGRLIYGAEIANGGGRRVRVLRATATGWVSEFGATAAGSSYGASVAIAGPRALVGDPGGLGGRGRVFTMTLDESAGTWDTGSTLTATPSILEAGFGRQVALAAGTALVGAETEPVNGLDDAGAAYVFALTQSTWSQASRFTAPTPSAGGRFGMEVAISGLNEATPDRMLIASYENAGAGRVYAYRRSVETWVSSFTITPPVTQAAQEFGATISLDGDVAVIGARRFDLGAVNAGVVYGVDFNANFTAATFVQRGDPAAQAEALAGFAVAIDREGPTVLVGAPLTDVDGNTDQGAVLMSIGSAGTPFPALQRVFPLGQGLTIALFGRSLSTQADTLVVGAPGEASGALPAVGAVYVYGRHPDGTYAPPTRIGNPQGFAADFFGEGVAVHGDLLLVGAPNVDTNGVDAGAVYVYRRSAGVWNVERVLLSPCNSTQRRAFGRRIEFDGTRAMIGGICPPPPGGSSADVGVDIATRQPDGSWTFGLAAAASRMSDGGWDDGLAVIGSHNANGNLGGVEAGLVRTFAFQGGQWQFVGTSDNGSNTPSPQGYGYDLGIDRGLLAVASYRPNTPVVVRRRSGTQFLPEASLLPSGLGANEAVQHVAVRGERIAVAAIVHTVTVNQQGAVFLFERQLGSWQQAQRLVASSPVTQSYFGSVMAFAEDGSLVVAAPEESSTFEYQGAVYVFAEPPVAVFSDGFE